MTDFGVGPRVPGKISIITGAGGGIGSVTAQMFAAHGSKLIVTDIDEAAAHATAAKITEAGGQAIAVQHDISVGADWDRVVALALANFGRIDVLVNNAGLHHQTMMGDITQAEWDKSIAVNLTGPFMGLQRVIPQMLKQGQGSIINVCSVAALIGGSFAHYSAAKGGVRSLTRTAAIAYAKQGIRVNALFPGLIETGLTAEARANPEIRAMLEASTALPRFGQPRDIAFGILYLASDESSFATGADFIIDGGVTAM